MGGKPRPPRKPATQDSPFVKSPPDPDRDTVEFVTRWWPEIRRGN